VSEKLVLNTFATLILFEDLYEEFSGAITAMLREDDGLLPSNTKELVRAYKEACRMRIWRKKTKNEIEKTIKAKIIDEVKKEYAEANPSAPALQSKLSAEQEEDVRVKTDKQTDIELKKAIENVFLKCKFLLLFETKDTAVKINIDDLMENKSRDIHW
jgi:hypothetical protein